MAKSANSVIGIDLGKHAFKSVLLQRKGDQRYVLTNYASRPAPEGAATADDIAQEIKLLLKEMGGNAKSCAIAASIARRFPRSCSLRSPRMARQPKPLRFPRGKRATSSAACFARR